MWLYKARLRVTEGPWTGRLGAQTRTSHHFVLKTYFPILVFAFLGLTVGGLFAMLNHLIGPKKPARATAASRRQGEPYESGIPVEPMRNFRFGISFYLIAMLFILFDIEVVFLYPVGVIMKGADSVFVLGELITFVVLLMLAFVYVWRKGALDWR
jgi:NADH-quinone oxidoreductase subunit A